MSAVPVAPPLEPGAAILHAARAAWSVRQAEAERERAEKIASRRAQLTTYALVLVGELLHGPHPGEGPHPDLLAAGPYAAVHMPDDALADDRPENNGHVSVRVGSLEFRVWVSPDSYHWVVTAVLPDACGHTAQTGPLRDLAALGYELERFASGCLEATELPL